VTADPRRTIPQVEQLVRDAVGEMDGLPRQVVVEAVREVLASVRRRARRTGEAPTREEIVAEVRDAVAGLRLAPLREVVNATGVILHTNLGRAPLAPEAVDAVVEVARGYSNLELDLRSGRRGDRHSSLEPSLRALTGAESALVVNNNAAAVLLVCRALAQGREVVISRGELIEIGGGFRIPDVVVDAGATLREVGTTNRTHLRDYERAIGEQTAFVLRVHPSNYRVVGFTASPPLGDLVALARSRRVPLVLDAGSGLVSEALGEEPLVRDAVTAGVDLVCFSGDKLLGGPQSGVVCGRRALVDRLKKHPLMRALRPDRMTIAALARTVDLHLGGRTGDLPVWRMIQADPGTLRDRSVVVLRSAEEHGLEGEIADGASAVGGGSLPGETVATPVIRLRHPRLSASGLAAALRAADPPVIGRVEGGRLVLDLRTVPAELDELVIAALRRT